MLANIRQKENESTSETLQPLLYYTGKIRYKGSYHIGKNWIVSKRAKLFDPSNDWEIMKENEITPSIIVSVDTDN